MAQQAGHPHQQYLQPVLIATYNPEIGGSMVQGWEEWTGRQGVAQQGAHQHQPCLQPAQL